MKSSSSARWVHEVMAFGSAASALALGGAGCPATRGGGHFVREQECRSCHQSDYLPATMVAAHTADTDSAECGNCHSESRWKPALFGTHPEDEFSLAAPHAYACLDCHAPAAGERANVSGTDCVGCHDGAHTEALAAQRHAHVPEYVYTAASPDFCLACHVDGTAAVQKHPEDRFPIQSGVHRYACIECHDRSRGSDFTAGANVNCVGCHEGAHGETVAAGRHAAVPEYIYDARNPAFCRACHPDGQSKVAHPEARFPITNGPHRYTCLDCHDEARGAFTGGANTNCVGCHTKAHTEALSAQQHANVPDYRFAAGRPNFCRDCHADGRQL